MSNIKNFNGYNVKNSSNCPEPESLYDSDDDVVFDVNESCVWAKAGNNYFPTQQVIRTIPPGQYTIADTPRGICLVHHDINLDEILILPDSASEEVVNEIELFWSKKEKFKEYGFLWKRGVLMYGPPGSGKTSTVQIISKKIIEKGGITLYCTNPMLDSAGLALLRAVEPDRPIVIIIEDIDSVINIYGESQLLALLDGQLQVDNVVFLATTNYPELLDNRIKNRPSRFDVLKEIGMPTEEARRIFIKNKHTNIDEKDLKVWVKKTEGYSIAHIKEIIISVECLGNSLEFALERIRNMSEQVITSTGTKQQIGIKGD